MPAGDTSLVMLMCEKCTFHLAIKKKPIKIFQNGFLLCTQQSVYNLNKVENKLFEIQKKKGFFSLWAHCASVNKFWNVLQ